jgi:N-acetylmuramoyl-L-alanine amidase
MMLRLPLLQVRVTGAAAAAIAGWVVVTSVLPAAHVAPAARTQNVYTIYTTDGRRTLPYRDAGGTDLISLEQLAGLFAFTVTEDSVLRGLVIAPRGGQRILAIPGQSFVQVAGKVASLGAPVQRERNSWLVPIEFLSQALGPATGQRIIVRRSSHLVLVGDVRVPQVSGQFEQVGAAGRLVLDIQPPAPHTISREGNRLVVRFDAAAIDPGPITGAPAEFITATRIEGPALILELGPSAATFRTEDEPSRVAIELLPPGPPPAPPPTTPTGPLPAIDPLPGMLRTVVIDPGHGGEDAGARGPGGASEKDITLQVARRLKAAIESRMGLRVLLTRDTDAEVPIDRRTSLANNNKADLFLSLHINASLHPDARGAQVLTLNVADYATETSAQEITGIAVPIVGGGTRTIRAVPWDLAQLPFADRSAALGAVLVRELSERGVPLYSRPAGQLPLRVLVGANMPAVLLEMGFLTNAQDEQALAGGLQATIVEALVDMIASVRRGLPQTVEQERRW